MQIKIKDEWKDAHPPSEPPYTYESEEEAERVLRMCYPDQMREQRLFGREFGRVVAAEGSIQNAQKA